MLYCNSTLYFASILENRGKASTQSSLCSRIGTDQHTRTQAVRHAILINLKCIVYRVQSSEGPVQKQLFRNHYVPSFNILSIARTVLYNCEDIMIRHENLRTLLRIWITNKILMNLLCVDLSKSTLNMNSEYLHIKRELSAFKNYNIVLQNRSPRVNPKEFFSKYLISTICYIQYILHSLLKF